MNRIESVYFELGGDKRYTRMARVLAASARMHCPGWAVNIKPCAAPLSAERRDNRLRRGLATNSDKLTAWTDVVCSAPDGDRIALLDADMMVLRPLDCVWDHEFDVAYTTKPVVRLPINGGVVFVRVNDRSRAFMRQWLEINTRLYHDPSEHKQWRAAFGGMNQAALGCLLNTPCEYEAHSYAALLELPCAEWNACNEDLWSKHSMARVVHIKSNLRRSVFRGRRSHIRPDLKSIREQWYAYDRAATT